MIILLHALKVRRADAGETTTSAFPWSHEVAKLNRWNQLSSKTLSLARRIAAEVASIAVAALN
jgi:hypothetical protein